VSLWIVQLILFLDTIKKNSGLSIYEQTNDNGNWRQLTDTVVNNNPTAKLSFIANYDYGHEDIGPQFELPYKVATWSGLAGYVKYAPNDRWAFALDSSASSAAESSKHKASLKNAARLISIAPGGAKNEARRGASSVNE